MTPILPLSPLFMPFSRALLLFLPHFCRYHPHFSILPFPPDFRTRPSTPSLCHCEMAFKFIAIGVQYTSAIVTVLYVYYSDKRLGYWIGLYKSVAEASDSSTYWLDGNPSTYRNWDAGQPNSANQCVRIFNGEFWDRPCSSTYRYVCKGIYFF